MPLEETFWKKMKNENRIGERTFRSKTAPGTNHDLSQVHLEKEIVAIEDVLSSIFVDNGTVA